MGNNKEPNSHKRLEAVKRAIKMAKAEKQKFRRKRNIRFMRNSLVMLMCLVITLPNLSSSMGYAMGKLPILGGVFKVVTFREYHYMDDRFEADVDVPGITVIEKKNSSIDDSLDTAKSDKPEFGNNEIAVVNAEIKAITNQLIEEFKENKKKIKEGYSNLSIKYDIIESDDKYLTVRLMTYRGGASGFEEDHYYTIDLKTGKKLVLSDFFDNKEYIEVLTNEVKAQMKAEMAENADSVYFIKEGKNSKAEAGFFNKIKRNQQFYIDKEKCIHLIFNEGEVAPNCMGKLDFKIPTEVLKIQ